MIRFTFFFQILNRTQFHPLWINFLSAALTENAFCFKKIKFVVESFLSGESA